MQDPGAFYQSMMANQHQPQFPEQEKLNCPRCDSPNTKFCYYNNYNLSQPRHFCKSCRRYWTKGGALRNVPVGGGSRKNAKRSTTVSSSLNTHKKTKNPDPDPGNKANPGLDPTRMLYGFPIGEQDVKVGGFSSLLASNMQLGLEGIMLNGSGWDSGIGLGLKTSESGNPWNHLGYEQPEKN